MENAFLFLTRLSALSLPPSDFLAQARFSPSEFSRFVSSPWQTFPFPPYSPNRRPLLPPPLELVRGIRLEKRKITPIACLRSLPCPVPPNPASVLKSSQSIARTPPRRSGAGGALSLARPRSRVVVQSQETLGPTGCQSRPRRRCSEQTVLASL